ncbi:hypothetical protein SNE40_017181 [Patella caerulea]|uniref:Ig-like domain-containing protein n=1 Tax=Patella caerulea TaxID=87958 RepID=A0AAN8JD85_PATCE
MVPVPYFTIISNNNLILYLLTVSVPYVTIISNNNLIFTDSLNTDVSCKSGVSYPPATITWSINGGNNLGNGTTSKNSDGTTTSILQYTADKSDDNKILQCTATNGYGPNKTDSITLNIRCKYRFF